MSNIMFFAMLSAWNVKFKDDGLMYLRGTSKIANGEFKSYLPKFLGFGKSNKMGSIGKINNGELVAWKRFNQYGDIVEYWNK